jgi:toxin ParE1/3/4
VAVRPVRLRALAAADLDEAAAYHHGHAGEQIALDFIDAVERAIHRIGHQPHLGTLRYGYELAIPGLRAWPVDRFPYALFYVDTDETVDVWRVLHARRDIPTSLHEPTT